MSYLAFDLDALKVVPDAARAAGVSEAQFGYGLVRLWSYCWTAKTENVKAAHLRGFFEAPDFSAVTGSLEAFGFAERTLGETYRVRGAERYLRVRKAQSDGGKAASGNLKQNATPPGTPPPAGSPGKPEVSRTTSPALTPNSEQRTASSEVKASALSRDPAEKSSSKKPSDPRHRPMVDRLVNAFRHAHGEYAFGGRDALAVTKLLALGDDDEISNRWNRALMRTGFPLVRTLPELVSNWNHFAGGGSIVGIGEITAREVSF